MLKAIGPQVAGLPEEVLAGLAAYFAGKMFRERVCVKFTDGENWEQTQKREQKRGLHEGTKRQVAQLTRQIK